MESWRGRETETKQDGGAGGGSDGDDHHGQTVQCFNCFIPLNCPATALLLSAITLYHRLLYGLICSSPPAKPHEKLMGNRLAHDPPQLLQVCHTSSSHGYFYTNIKINRSLFSTRSWNLSKPNKYKELHRGTLIDSSHILPTKLFIHCLLDNLVASQSRSYYQETVSNLFSQ